jgi:superfamily I DNA and/or RNA helicase
MVRPYSGLGWNQLKQAFLDNQANLRVLKQLRAEIKARENVGSRTLALLREIEQTLANLKHQAGVTLHGSSGDAQLDLFGEASPSASKPTNGSRKHPQTKPARPAATATPQRTQTHVRPCGNWPDLPGPRAFPPSESVTFRHLEGSSPIDLYIESLQALIQEMKRAGAGSKRIAVENGQLVASIEWKPTYEFVVELEGDEALFEGATVTAIVDGLQLKGQIHSIFKGRIWLTLEEGLGPTIRVATLVVDNTAMLEALATRFEKIRSGEAKINQPLALDAIKNKERAEPPAAISNEVVDRHDLNEQQAEAVALAMSNKVMYLWGPPGTGKTQTLTALLELLFDEGKRILICSNTNQAVDQVLLKICKGGEDGIFPRQVLIDGKVVRVGKIQHEDLETFRDWVDLDGIVERKSVDLRAETNQTKATIARIQEQTEKAGYVLSLFRKLDGNRTELQQLNDTFNRAAANHRQVSLELTRWQGELNKYVGEWQQWQAAGRVRRVFLRAEAKITKDIERTRIAIDRVRQRIPTHQQVMKRIEAKLAPIRTAEEDLASRLAKLNRNMIETLINSNEQKLTTLRARLVSINKQLEDLRNSLIREARIIGATVTKSYLSPQVFDSIDVVIIDEASMVLLPAVYHTAGLAKEKVVISGDFRQLPPIVPSKEKAVLDAIGHNVFHYAGIADAIHRRSGKRVVMLEKQYRMAEPICQIISQPMYEGRLKTALKNNKEDPLPPSPFDRPLSVVDTSTLYPFVNRDAFNSRFNLMNALVIRNLCRHLYQSGYVANAKSLGVCTPYAAQAKLIRTALADQGWKDKLIAAGTVHRYQGDEKRMMILDIPDSLGEKNVGIFLDAIPPDSAGAKLFNVAVSRSEQHLVLIANIGYLDEKLPGRSFVRHILYEAQRSGNIIDAREILAMWPIVDDIRRLGFSADISPEALKNGLFHEGDFQAACIADIRNAKQSIVIYSPFYTPQRIATYADLFRLKIEEGVGIRCVTRTPANNPAIPHEQSTELLDALEQIGCIVDTRWGMHEKALIIDDQVVWFGSLNALSHNGKTQEVMTRIEGNGLARQLLIFLSIERRSATAPNHNGIHTENPRCPDCGRRVAYHRKGRYGPYWKCEDDLCWTRSARG